LAEQYSFGLVDKNGKVLAEGNLKTTDYPKINVLSRRLSPQLRNCWQQERV